MRGSRRAFVLGTFLSFLAPSLSVHAADARSRPLLVFAAASLTDAMDEIGAAYTRETGRQIRLSYAASSVLARQLEAGARADVFFCADAEWMDYAQARNLIDKSTRKDLLGNRLVLVAPARSNIRLEIAPHFALAAALGPRRLATGDPDSVPAGKYARAALTSLGVWNEVEDRLIRAENVRSALTFVSRSEAPLGIVYETDALVDKGVRIVGVFPANSHLPIVYPVAATAVAQPAAKHFVAYLGSESASGVFRKYGFSIRPRRSP